MSEREKSFLKHRRDENENRNSSDSFVWSNPDPTQLAAGTISLVDENGRVIELGKYDVNAECSKLPEQYGRSGTAVTMDLPKGLTADAFITWDETCYYGVWGWGKESGWVSSKVDNSVELKNSSTSILLTKVGFGGSLPFAPTSDESTCIEKSKELLQRFPKRQSN